MKVKRMMLVRNGYRSDRRESTFQTYKRRRVEACNSGRDKDKCSEAKQTQCNRDGHSSTTLDGSKEC